jgi:hypothetical protein
MSEELQKEWCGGCKQKVVYLWPLASGRCGKCVTTFYTLEEALLLTPDRDHNGIRALFEFANLCQS